MTIRFPKINLEFNNVPRAFSILGYEVTVFGALLAAGMFLGLLLILLHAKRKSGNANRYLGAAIFAIFGGVIGARALYAFCCWDMFAHEPIKLLAVRDGGMSLYGALIGGSLFVLLYSKIVKSSFLEIADILTPGILLCQVIARWGDFFNRCSFGEYADAPFAMQLPLYSVRSGEVTDLMREKAVTFGNVSFISVTPLFLFESVFCFVLMILLIANSRKKKFTGIIFYRYLAWYGLARFGIEWFRTDKLMIPGTKTGISLVLAAASFIFFGLVIRVRSSLASKRSALKKQWRDKDYPETGIERAEAAAKLEESRSFATKEEIRERVSAERLASAEAEQKAREEEQKEEEQKEEENAEKDSEEAEPDETETPDQKTSEETEVSDEILIPPLDEGVKEQGLP